MIEIPESTVLAQQINRVLKGKTIVNVIAAKSPHKFAWFYKNPEDYSARLRGKAVETAEGLGSMVEIAANDAILLFGDGVRLTFHPNDSEVPEKHQLLIEFEGRSFLSASVQMYGGLWCFRSGDFDNPYYKITKEKPLPTSECFTKTYYENMIDGPEVQKLGMKAFLATEQRIPGLGNGVLQDILYEARLHPKRKVGSLSKEEKSILYKTIKALLLEMIQKGGRDTENDLFGNKGAYLTKMSKHTVVKPCPRCGTTIVKESYLGGSIYYCPTCQQA
jgi:formamidopyrimidine-DNA glycosylase